MSKKRPTVAREPESTEDQVKLKPILGIRPGHYLTVIYSLILLGVIFFLLIFPGIRRPGVVLAVKTEPAGAAIRVDDTYMGTSKDRIFVSKGRHTLMAVLPGFTAQSSVHEIPGRVFASLFFPLRYPVEFSLKTNDPAAVLADAASDFAEWTFAGEPTAAWQAPLSLSEGAYRIGPDYAPSAMDILQAASRFTTTRAALRDIVRAKMLLDNGGLSPSPASLAGSVSDILVFLSENPGSAQWLANLLPPESAAVVKASNWYKNVPADSNQTVWYGVRRSELDGLSFIDIASPYGFMISQTTVPRSLFETFLNENPSWRNDEIFPDVLTQGTEITGVSWYSAEAFCQWFTKRLPSSMAGMEARLPTEEEWINAEESGITMKSGSWEWCGDPYVPLNFINADPKAARAVGSPERPLRGADLRRASLPPDLASPIVSFRVVISKSDD